MRPIHLNRSLIEYTIILGIRHIVAVPVSLCQKLCNHKEKSADFLIHSKHGLLSMYIINYPIYMPLVAAFLEYEQHVKNEGIVKRHTILAKSNGYPMQIVHLETTINKPVMRRGGYFYACTPNGIGLNQWEA